MSFLKAADEVLIIVTPDPASLTDGYAAAKALLKDDPTAEVSLILNMVENEHEAKQVYAHLFSVVQRFLNARLKYAKDSCDSTPGAVSFIRKRIPFVVGNPNLPASVGHQPHCDRTTRQRDPRKRGWPCEPAEIAVLSR